MPKFSKQQLTHAIEALAKACGAPADEARTFAQCHVRADLRGHATQGLQIVNIIFDFLASGVEKFAVETPILKEGPAFAVMDGNRGVGCVVATRAMDYAIKKAQTSGIACVWVRQGGIFSMASNYAMQALDHDQIGIAAENGVPFVAPWGGRDPFFSTNPFSMAIPSEKELPIVIDMAAGSFSAGNVLAAKKAGKRMPSPHLVDKAGNYTDNPSSIDMAPDHQINLGGIVAQGPRGYGWTIMVEMLAGILSGMEASYKNIVDTHNNQIDLNHGQFFMAINVQSLMQVDIFKQKVDQFIQSLTSNRPATGFESVRLPGEQAAINEKNYLENGIPVQDRDWDQFCKQGNTLGLDMNAIIAQT